jgi:acetyl esterase/lipase
MSIPETISPEARRFYEEAEPLVKLDLGNVEQLRAEDHEEAMRANPAIIERYVDGLEEGVIAGVPVLTVTPKGYSAANDKSIILYFFGGAFVVGSPHVDLKITAPLAAHTGCKVVAPYYRRAPEHPWPAATGDGIAVYRDMLESGLYDRVAMVGESAGGNLALALCHAAREQGLGLPAVTVLMSPWCDLTPSGESQKQPTGFDPTLDYELQLRVSAAAYCGEIDQKDARVSPLYADYPADFPPTLITTGTRDLFLSDCARLATTLRQAGADVRLDVREGMWHVFEWYNDVPEARESLAGIAAFIAQQVG